MKTLIALLILTGICFAEVSNPYILIRKADNQVVGVGYTKFEGVSNLQDYEVREIEPKDIDKYNKEIEKYKDDQRIAKEQEKAVKKEAIKAKLNLTEEDFKSLTEAIK